MPRPKQLDQDKVTRVESALNSIADNPTLDRSQLTQRDLAQAADVSQGWLSKCFDRRPDLRATLIDLRDNTPVQKRNTAYKHQLDQLKRENQELHKLIRQLSEQLAALSLAQEINNADHVTMGNPQRPAAPAADSH